MSQEIEQGVITLVNLAIRKWNDQFMNKHRDDISLILIYFKD